MKRLVMRTILFVLPKMLEFTARRHPAFRERLKQHDVTAWFGLMDESIGATIAIRGGKVFAQAGSRAEADVALVFQDVYTALVFLMPGPDQGEIIHAAKNFKVRDRRSRRPPPLVHSDVEHEPDRRDGDGRENARRKPSLYDLHQWRSHFRLCQGRQDFAHDADRFRRQGRADLGDRGARQTFPAQAGRIGRAARLVPEIAGLFRQANSLIR